MNRVLRAAVYGVGGGWRGFIPCIILCLVTALTACSGGGATASPEALVTESPSPQVTPSVTPIPLAAVVDGEGIPLSLYQEELARFEAAQLELGIDLATLEGYQDQVLQQLIDRRLLAQGAQQAGVEILETDVDARMEALAAEVGGNESLAAWITAQGYTVEHFRMSLREDMLAAEMVRRIIDSLPEQVEHVHARHILVASREEAQALLDQLANGADFAPLAAEHSLDLSTRLAGGDLGYFPSGTLTTPEVEQAAFSLEPGELSGIVESELGFHLVETLHVELRKPSGESLKRLRQQAVREWIASRRDAVRIESLIEG